MVCWTRRVDGRKPMEGELANEDVQWERREEGRYESS